ncbi:MAG: type IV secretory system conjugative DNA transfer family protein [Ktedonobacteraceae bacterium]
MGTLALHRARFAKRHELSELLQKAPCPDGVLLGKRKDWLFFNRFVVVRPTEKRREIGNCLIVAPTRGGKGLLAISQLLSWKHSVIVNDIKGELFQATAGYRSTLGNVYVIDPTGVGHRYDPLQEKKTEDALLSAATHLLYQADEGDGRIFTERASVMLSQLFAAAKLEGAAPLPYARHSIRAGLSACAARLHAVSPELATQFLDVQYQDANFADRFLLSSWGTLTARMRPLLTETVVRCFTHSDFTAEQIMKSGTPVTIYLRWKEQDLLALSPLVRLLWGSLINELITTYDSNQGKECQPVLLLIDEAGRTAIPSLADHATTIVGRGIHMWIALQSLSQLEVVYGRARAQVLRDNMESQLYYRPIDLATAQHLEVKLGKQSAYAYSITEREGTEPSEGQTEQPIPLLTAQEIMQLKDEEMICFHRRLPPFKISRMDWRQHPTLTQRRNIPAPQLFPLTQIADLPTEISQTFRLPHGYIDPDMLN